MVATTSTAPGEGNGTHTMCTVIESQGEDAHVDLDAVAEGLDALKVNK